mgnify:CR=1 FL=1
MIRVKKHKADSYTVDGENKSDVILHEVRFFGILVYRMRMTYEIYPM